MTSWRPRFTVDIPEVDAKFRCDESKVYVVKCGDFVKIGRARNVEQRMRDIQSANPHTIELLFVSFGGNEVEKELHRRFAAYKHRDEWFRLEGEVAEWIQVQRDQGAQPVEKLAA